MGKQCEENLMSFTGFREEFDSEEEIGRQPWCMADSVWHHFPPSEVFAVFFTHPANFNCNGH